MNHIGGRQGTGMRPDVRADVLARLKSGYGFKEVKGWLREGKCPQCGEKELFVSAENPWRVKCGRYNRCGYEASTKELFPDAFGRWNERFPATTEDPNATADAYMDGERGLPLRKIRGWFRQGQFKHPHGNRATATVVFDLDRERGIFMERFVEPVVVSIPGKEPDERKANFVGKHAGMAWVPPGVDVAALAELWLVEGCIDATSLTVRGTAAAATLSAANYPADLLSLLDPKKTRLVWALDNDAAGTGYIRKHVETAKATGFECRAALVPQGKQKTDWNDAFKAGNLTGDGAEKFLDLTLFEGDLLLARNAREKGTLVWERTRAASFAIIYDRRTYWYRFDQGAYDKQLEEIQNTGMQDHPRGQEFAAAEKSATVTEIANCETKFLYFQQNKATDESWYYSLIKFPDGRRFKNTFTGSQLSAGSEFKKRLMTIAPGALYLGGTNQLNWIIGKHLDGIKVVDTVDFIGYTMNALFLRDLAAKVRRGQKGNIAAGKSAGGLSYGYDVVRELDAKGEPIRGQRVVNPEQADVVRRVYREYVSGLSARQIAHGLNRDGIPSPAGGIWRVSVISGNRARASGILWNDAYRGRLVYNRIRMIKDPETGKRISRPNPPEEWVCVDAPHLRIIDDATWEAVQAVKDRYSTCGARGERKPKHLLSGLLRCPVCGGAYTVYASDKAGCGTRRDAGTCSNDRTIIVSEAEQRVLSGMRSRLVHPKALAAFITSYESERKRLRADREQQMHHAKTRLAEAEKQIDNIIDAVANGFATEGMKKRLMDAEAEAAALRQQIAAAPPENVIALHPAAIAEYRRNVEHLFDALKSDDIAKAEASTLLRAVIDHIDVVPLEGRGKYDLKVVTRLETLIGLAQGAQADRFVSMVAEEGLEPPTRGL